MAAAFFVVRQIQHRIILTKDPAAEATIWKTLFVFAFSRTIATARLTGAKSKYRKVNWSESDTSTMTKEGLSHNGGQMSKLHGLSREVGLFVAKHEAATKSLEFTTKWVCQKHRDGGRITASEYQEFLDELSRIGRNENVR
jgi:hypothetical protein